MTQHTNTSPSSNGHSTLKEIFVLSDEQILEIDPEPQDVEVSADSRSAAQRARQAPASPEPRRASSPAHASDDPAQPFSTESRNARDTARAEDDAHRFSTGHGTRDTEHADPAANAADASTNTNAPATPFASPEDLRAVAELYPGGLTQAKSTAERARTLDEIDAAYFGAAAHSPEQISASRAQLAQRMLRENPAAFREMVFAGLRALEELNVATPFRAASGTVGAGFSPSPPVAQPFLAVPATNAPGSVAAQQHRPGDVYRGGAPQLGNSSAHGAQAGIPAPPEHLAAYAAFENAANADLEKSVGGAIDRALHQALPNVGARFSASPGGATHETAPLQARLSQAIREDVERALQSDRQLGEQVAQILASRRLDNETRAQVVRLINDRALQLVPGAAKRALNDWTQATLAAHRGKTARADTASSRREVTAAAPVPRDVHAGKQNAAPRAERSTTPASKGRINYGKVSDEQILEM